MKNSEDLYAIFHEILASKIFWGARGLDSISHHQTFRFLATGNRLSTVFVIAKTTLLFPFTLTPATLCIWKFASFKRIKQSCSAFLSLRAKHGNLFHKRECFFSRIFSHRLNVYVQDEFFRRQREAWTTEAIMNKLSAILPKKIFNRKIKISEKIGKTPKRSFSVKNLVIITGFRWVEKTIWTSIFTFFRRFQKRLDNVFFCLHLKKAEKHSAMLTQFARTPAF